VARATRQQLAEPLARKGRTPTKATPPATHRRRALVDPVQFLLATRDTGYRSTSAAVAELVDNSIQAGATTVGVEVTRGNDPTWPIEIRVADDGVGMTDATLADALAFGGSSRFDDRHSLGRYGMGLPNAGLSRARRIEVHTWQGRRTAFAALDIDAFIHSGRKTLAPVERVSRPSFAPAGRTGTVVTLKRCDRLEHQRPSTVAAHLSRDLGRMYRWPLVGGIQMRVNGEALDPIDPLMLMSVSGAPAGRPFGSVLRYRLPGYSSTGLVEVRFSELPVAEWHDLPSDEKRRLGVTGTPCVSVVRAGREIDRGWFFMGAKRHENYDDWWRAEISFDPDLDELFGITHSKQGINPVGSLCELLARDLEPIARALNSRVRRSFELLRSAEPLAEAERRASSAARRLPPLPRRGGAKANSEILASIPDPLLLSTPGPTHRILVQDLPTTVATEVVLVKGRLALLINAQHPLYRDLLGPLAESGRSEDVQLAVRLLLTLLAAARAEAGLSTVDRRAASKMRQAWSDITATFLNS
jgi:hypothetical protein